MIWFGDKRLGLRQDVKSGPASLDLHTSVSERGLCWFMNLKTSLWTSAVAGLLKLRSLSDSRKVQNLLLLLSVMQDKLRKLSAAAASR